MFRIGICDDNKRDLEYLKMLCERYFQQYSEAHEYITFTSGEEVLQFCQKKEEKQIDLLFLDVEMAEISGIEVKEKVTKSSHIWRIVFVSSHANAMVAAFGLKTLGFEVKPAKFENICHWIQIVHQEKMEKVAIEIREIDQTVIRSVPLEEIAFLKAERNYTRVIFCGHTEQQPYMVLTSKQIGQWEEELKEFPVIRVHKSYLVNVMNIIQVGQTIVLRDIEEEIPIGRVYNKFLKSKYKEYAMDKMRRRL